MQRIGAERGVGDAGFLEVQDVEVVVADGLAPDLGGGAGARGTGGTLMATTARTRSGKNNGKLVATGEPQSWPTITARSAPTSSSNPAMSAVSSVML